MILFWGMTLFCRQHCRLSICFFSWSLQILRRLPQPPESGCRIFEGPQLSQNWLQLRFLDWLALPRTLRFTWSTFGSLSFITKCLKTAFPLRSPPLTVLNSGKLPQGFVLEQNSISFSLKTCISSSRRIVLNSGKQGFLSNLQKDFHFHCTFFYLFHAWTIVHWERWCSLQMCEKW